MVGNVKNRSESMQDIIARALALRNNSSSDLNSAVKAIQPLSEIVSYGENTHTNPKIMASSRP